MELNEAVNGHAIALLSCDELSIIASILLNLPEIVYWEKEEILTQEEMDASKQLLSEIKVAWNQRKYMN